MTAIAAAESPSRPVTPRSSRPALVLGAMVLLLVVYGVLSLANDPRGSLGTDTGGKLATLATMERHGSLTPDLGYWAAEYDPEGALHPIFYTRAIDGRFVNLTTLPMVLAAAPLYDVGGPRLVLVLPMLGAAFAALAARALARRISGGDGWWAFWAVGLASPIAVYALDFWEHAPGVALVLWGVVFCQDLAQGRAGWRGALAAGALFGAAATMRTDALVYAAVAALVTAAVMATHWRTKGSPTIAAMIRDGCAWLGGFSFLLVANQLLERTIVGGGIRAGRTADTAHSAGTDWTDRIKEAVTTSVGVNRFEHQMDAVIGALIVGLCAYAAWKLLDPGHRQHLLGTIALVGVGCVYALRFADGLDFVPGVLSASPLAIVGLTVAWTAKRWRMVGAIAILAIPLVWFAQYSGGASPQWGGRYLLVSGTLLVVGAAVVLAATPGSARYAFVALGLLVTLGGAAWLSQRSHAVAAAMPHFAVDRDTVLVSRERHLLREGGDFYRPDEQWLTAVNDEELIRAVDIAHRVGAQHLKLVAVAGRKEPRQIGGYRAVARERLEFVPGLDVVIVSYDVERRG